MAAQCNFLLHDIWFLKCALGKQAIPVTQQHADWSKDRGPFQPALMLAAQPVLVIKNTNIKGDAIWLNLPGKYSRGVLLLSALPHLCQCHWTSGSGTAEWSSPWEQTKQEAMRVFFQNRAVFSKKEIPVQNSALCSISGGSWVGELVK